MFFIYFILIIVAFSLAYYSVFLITLPTNINEQLSDWVSIFIIDRENLILTFLILLLIFFLLNIPSKYMFKILLSGSNPLLRWEKVKAIVLLTLIINLYLYLFLKYGWYLIIPLLFFLITKITLLNRW